MCHLLVETKVYYIHKSKIRQYATNIFCSSLPFSTFSMCNLINHPSMPMSMSEQNSKLSHSLLLKTLRRHPLIWLIPSLDIICVIVFSPSCDLQPPAMTWRNIDARDLTRCLNTPHPTMAPGIHRWVINEILLTFFDMQIIQILVPKYLLLMKNLRWISVLKGQICPKTFFFVNVSQQKVIYYLTNE